MYKLYDCGIIIYRLSGCYSNKYWDILGVLDEMRLLPKESSLLTGSERRAGVVGGCVVDS